MKKILFVCMLSLFSFKITNAQRMNADSLKQKLASSKEDTAKVNLLANLALLYTFSYPDTAVNYATRGLELAQELNYKSGEARCFGLLCLSLTFLGNYTSALGFGLKALPIFEDVHDTTSLVWTNIQIANCYIYLEDYDQALVYGYKAKKLFRFSNPNLNQISVGFGVIGTTYEKQNQLDSALYYEQKAFSWDSSWSGIFGNMGEIYAKLGRSDLALDYYRRGIPVAAKRNNSIDFVKLYNDMSKVFELTGHIDSSIYYANKSILQPGVQVNPEGLLQASTQLANLYKSKRIPDSTIKYLQLTIALKDSLFSRKKTREAQGFAFNKKLHQQELVAQQQEDKNKIKLYALLAVIIIFLIIAFMFWRNNRLKQKANTLLESKNLQIENALQELKSTQSQLIQSAKMASLGELTAGIAHEIQNPLNFVNNFSDVNTELIDELKIELGTGNTQQAIELANDIKDNEQKINHHGKRADAIVKGMLQHSRSSSGVKEPTDINALCDEYIRLSYHGLRAKDKSFNATMKTDFDETIGKINIITQDIGRVILNLYNNAFYAVDEKKKSGIENYEPTVSVSTKKLNGKVQIRVGDNGNGIPPKVLDKIFQPFFTTKPTGQGTGLGLSLAYDIIKAFGGEIKVETKENEGSTFIIYLPDRKSVV